MDDAHTPVTYDVLPEFLDRSEQRISGLVTNYQMLALICGMFPGLMLARADFWHLVWYVPVLAVVFFGVSPTEGTLRIVVWTVPLMAQITWFRHKIANWQPWHALTAQHSDHPTQPIYFMNQAELVLSAEVRPAR